MIWNWLINDEISNNKKTIYAKRGELVTVIANHYPAMIVMTQSGCKFSTHINNLSNIKINKDEPNKYEQGNNVKAARRVKR
jgi:hypothetical protein